MSLNSFGKKTVQLPQPPPVFLLNRFFFGCCFVLTKSTKTVFVFFKSKTYYVTRQLSNLQQLSPTRFLMFFVGWFLVAKRCTTHPPPPQPTSNGGIEVFSVSKLGGLDPPAANELDRHLEEANLSPRVGVVSVTGAGRIHTI